jgi:beta propeller repeat protein
MKRYRFPILVILFAVLLHAVAFAGAEIRITIDPGWQYLPAISSNRVVWYDNRNTGNQSYWDIYLYDVTTGIETKITSTPLYGLLSAPAISGNRIVWADNRTGNWDIYLYDIATGTETQITSDPANQFKPAISGDKIVWEDDRNSPAGSHDIYLYDLATGIETQITANSSFEQSPSISGNWIVWEDNRNGNWDIYLYDITTGVTTQITTDAHSQWHPVISGDTIAWEDDRNCNDPQCNTFSGNWDIYMYNLSTGVEAPVTTAPGNQSNLSISGNRIVWEDKRNASPFNYDIYMYDLATSAETPIITESHDQVYPVISGDRIVWADNRSGNWDIFEYDFLSEAPGTLTALVTSPSDDWLPVWSPDGTKILFSSDRTGTYNIWVMDADGNNLKRLTTTDFAAAVVPDWSPDGTQILFNSNQGSGGGWDFWVMNSDGSNQTQITFDHADYGHPRWSPDGTRIAFNSIRGGSSLNIWVANIDGTNMHQLTANAGENVSAEWSPDSSKICFSSNRSGNYNVYVMNADGTDQTPLTSNPTDERGGCKWSPDGKKLLFTRSNNGQSDIWMMDPDGSNQVPLLATPYHEYQPDVSPDGTKIVFTSNRFGSNDIWVMTMVPILTSHTISATAGPNGSISPSGSLTVNAGNNANFTIAPDPGYRLNELFIDGVKQQYPRNPYPFYNVQADHTISASFTLDVYTITATVANSDNSVPAHGSMMPSGTFTVNKGGSVTFNISPDAGYQVSSIIDNGTNNGATTSYLLSNIAADHTVTVYLKPITYAITATAGAGGKISPAGVTTLNAGGSQTYTITPNAGYSIADVMVGPTGGTLSSVGAVSSYPISNITANMTIAATFAPNPTYTITASAGSNGSISPNGAVSVLGGTNKKFTITPDAGYRMYELFIDGVKQEYPRNPYTFTNVQAAHTIDVTFVLDVYNIIVTAATGGSVTVMGTAITPTLPVTVNGGESSTITVNPGANVTLNIAPDAGRSVRSVVDNGSYKYGITTYSLTNIKANHTINVYFK